MHEVNMQCSIFYCDCDYELLSGVCEDLFIGALLVLSLSVCCRRWTRASEQWKSFHADLKAITTWLLVAESNLETNGDASHKVIKTKLATSPRLSMIMFIRETQAVNDIQVQNLTLLSFLCMHLCKLI